MIYYLLFIIWFTRDYGFFHFQLSIFHFQLFKPFTLHLCIPEHALQTMGLPVNGRYMLSPLLHATSELLMIDNELAITGDNFTYEVYQLSKK